MPTLFSVTQQHSNLSDKDNQRPNLREKHLTAAHHTEDTATATTAKHYQHSRRSQGTPGVTGSMLWDSGVILGKFLEHAVESGTMLLQGKKVLELGSGYG
ncbi:hypothetical protein CsSME_00027063 [Camellia sinensis var. sinensis]